ncbi:MAG TPA: CheB methylesterase domain-containing protein, partial [Dehalococcoidia bacterium]|nr:CheB methylesterase domain-containing protein [Dehalococcoidia bacterium]
MPTQSRQARRYRVIAIGASTGGPGAVVEILRALPFDFPLPVLLVLHIGEPFGAAFADWLAGRTDRSVSYARGGELLSSSAGQVLMAPPGRHLVVRGDRLWLTNDAERHSCRPSVDVLFESLAQEVGAAAALCLLTGMGKDGAAGLLAARKAGALTIAQDEATCVVYGMPREAVRLGAAERILPLQDIGPALASLGRHGQ